MTTSEDVSRILRFWEKFVRMPGDAQRRFLDEKFTEFVHRRNRELDEERRDARVSTLGGEHG